MFYGGCLLGFMDERWFTRYLSEHPAGAAHGQNCFCANRARSRARSIARGDCIIVYYLYYLYSLLSVICYLFSILRIIANTVELAHTNSCIKQWAGTSLSRVIRSTNQSTREFNSRPKKTDSEGESEARDRQRPGKGQEKPRKPPEEFPVCIRCCGRDI